MDYTFPVALALTGAAALVVWRQLQGKRPELDVAAAASPSKRRPKKKAAPKKPEAFKWDAVEKAGPDAEGAQVARRKVKAHDPIAAGAAMVHAAQSGKKKDDETKKQLSERQRNKLQSQGFVSVEDKRKASRRSASESSVGPTDDDEDDMYSGMSAEAAERLKLLERIASGKRAGPEDFAGDRKKPAATIGQERRVDHNVVRQRLDEQKRERMEREAEKTKPRGGRIAFQGAAVVKGAGASAWARPAAPAASRPEAVLLPDDDDDDEE